MYYFDSALSLFKGDTEFAMKCHEAFLAGQVALDHFLWNETSQYYNAYSNEDFDYEMFASATHLEVCGISDDGAPAVLSKGDTQDKEIPSGQTCVEGKPATPGAIMADSFYSQVGFPTDIIAGFFFVHTMSVSDTLST